MTPKVVLYYYRGNEAEYKILRSLNSAQEFLLEKNRWPILIDLSFKPMIAVKGVCCTEKLSRHTICISIFNSCNFVRGPFVCGGPFY